MPVSDDLSRMECTVVVRGPKAASALVDKPSGNYRSIVFFESQFHVACRRRTLVSPPISNGLCDFPARRGLVKRGELHRSSAFGLVYVEICQASERLDADFRQSW